MTPGVIVVIAILVYSLITLYLQEKGATDRLRLELEERRRKEESSNHESN